MTSRDEVWIYVSSTGEIHAFDTQAQAINASVDDPGDAWIELVTIQGATGAQQSHETGFREPGWDRVDFGPHTGAQSVHVPTGTGMTYTYNPWADPNGAA